MSSNTTRVSLYKPAGGEDINVTTDLNNNLDKLDTNLNFRVVANAAARNAVTPFWEGLNVRETDTGKCYVSNGSAPISGSWKQLAVADATFDADLDLASGKQINIGGVASSASFAVVNSVVGDDLITSRVGADSQSRYLVNSDGSTWWGPGNATQDTNLYRSGVSTLTTDDSFQIGGDALVSGNTTLTGDLLVGGIGQVQYSANTANQTVTNSTTMVNATNMSVPVVANATYVFECNLSVSGGNSAGDIKFGFTMPTGAQVDYGGQGLDIGLGSSTAVGTINAQGQENQTSPTTALSYGVSGNVTRIMITGQLRMSSTAGTLQLQFAQNSLSATGSVLRARSFMTVTRVA